jgi:transcriptional regulator with XRE-family HTH domain
MTMIRLSGSQLHAARVLVGLSREDVAERAGLCRHSIRKWETSSDAVPAATYSHLCRVVDMLESEGARFSGDGVSALSGESPDYLMEVVPPSINSNDSKGLHLAARARHAGVSHARHEQEPQSARVLQWFAARLPSDEHFRSFSAR